MGTYFVVSLIVYCLILLAISVYGYKKTGNSIEGYAIANGNVGGIIAGLAVYTSYMSTSSYMGVPAFFYQWGWPTFAHAIGSVFGATLAIVVCARRTRLFAKKLNSMSIVDFLADRYQSKVYRLILVITTFILYITVLVSTYKALGLIMQEGTGLSYELAVIISAVVVGVTIIIGGIYADIFTDAFQAIMMLAVVLILVPMAFKEIGGFSGFNAGLESINPASVQVSESSFWTPLQQFIQIPYWFAAFLALPYVANKFLVIKSAKEIRNLALFFLLGNFVGVALLIGGGQALVLFGNIQPDYSILQLITGLAPQWLAVPLLLAIMAAAMSSTDGVIHAASNSVGVEFYKKFLVPLRGKDPNSAAVSKKSLWLSRLSVIIFTVVPVYFAIYHEPPFLSLLLFWGLSFAICTIVPPLLVGLFWKKATALSVIIGSLSAVSVYLTFIYVLDTTVHIGGVSGAVVGTIIIIAVSLIQHKVYAGRKIPTYPYEVVEKLFPNQNIDIIEDSNLKI